MIRQVGTPAEVYREPADPWVAGFVGDAVLLPASVTAAGRADTALGPVRLHDRDGAAAGAAVTVLLRPEQIRVTGPAAGATTAVVVGREFHGHDSLLTVRLADGTEITARVAGGAAATMPVRPTRSAGPSACGSSARPAAGPTPGRFGG